MDNKLSVDFTNLNSIKEALNFYDRYLDEILVQPIDLYNMELLHIMSQDKQLNKEELFENDILKSVVQLSCDLDENSIFRSPKNEYNNSLAVFTQCYLLQKALDYNLENEVLNIALKFVNYTVKINDSENLWYDDCNVYGIDIIATLALNKPKYIHLISEYIIPYWDDEHAAYVFEYLRYFKNKFGFSRDMLKAYAYCNNSYNFSNNFSYMNENYEDEISTELYDFFKQNKEEYNYFKEQFLQYLHKYPRATEDEKYIHIADDFFQTIAYEAYKNMENESFQDITLEEEILNFTDEIDEVLLNYSKKDYVFCEENNDEYDDEEIEDYEEEIEDTIRINEEFFLKGFDEGEKIYDYVLFGKHKEILEEIPTFSKLEYFNTFAKKHDLEIIKRFNYYGTDFLDDIIEPFISQQLDCEVRQSLFSKLFSKKQDITPNERALRVVDVFYRLMNKKSFDEHTIKSITQNFELCTLEELFKRYTNTKIDKDEHIKDIKSLMNQFFDDEMTKEELEQLNALFLKDKSLWDEILNSIMHNRGEGLDEDVLAVLPGLHNSKVIGNHILTIAFIAYKNYKENDEDINKLINFYINNVLLVFTQILKENGKTDYYEVNELINQEYLVDDVYKYCKGIDNEVKIKDIMNELAYINDEDSSKTQNLGRETGIYQICFFSSDDIQALLASIIYANKFLSKEQKALTKKIYNLILELAPVKTIHETSKSFLNTSKIKDEKSFNDFLYTLREFGIKEEYILAWHINRAIAFTSCNNEFMEEELDKLIDAYIEEPNHKEVIKYLDYQTSREFLKRIHNKMPIDEYYQVCKEQFNKMIFEFSRRILPWENPEWNMKEEEKKEYKQAIINRANLIENFLFNEGSFDEIENFIKKENTNSLPSDLNEIIHFFDKKVQEKFIYLLAKTNSIKRLHQFFRSAYEEEFETYGLTHKLFDILISCGADKEFALYFIIEQAMRDEEYAQEEEDKNFSKAFYDIYAQLDIVKLSQDYDENEIIFIIRLIAKDDNIDYLNIKNGLLREFTKHKKLKIQKEATKFLD